MPSSHLRPASANLRYRLDSTTIVAELNEDTGSSEKGDNSGGSISSRSQETIADSEKVDPSPINVSSVNFNQIQTVIETIEQYNRIASSNVIFLHESPNIELNCFSAKHK